MFMVPLGLEKEIALSRRFTKTCPIRSGKPNKTTFFWISELSFISEYSFVSMKCSTISETVFDRSNLSRACVTKSLSTIAASNVSIKLLSLAAAKGTT